jgi:hypothetical protein
VWSARVRSVVAAVLLIASLYFGIDSISVFGRIGPPPPPITTRLEYARWDQYREVKIHEGMGDAFALDYVNSFGMPAAMGLALAAAVLAFFGSWARRVDRWLCALSGVWLVVVFVLSIRFGAAHRVDAEPSLDPPAADRVINAG